MAADADWRQSVEECEHLDDLANSDHETAKYAQKILELAEQDGGGNGA